MGSHVRLLAFVYFVADIAFVIDEVFVRLTLRTNR